MLGYPRVLRAHVPPPFPSHNVIPSMVTVLPFVHIWIPPDPPGKLEVLGHDGDSFCMDRTQIRVLYNVEKVTVVNM